MRATLILEASRSDGMMYRMEPSLGALLLGRLLRYLGSYCLKMGSFERAAHFFLTTYADTPVGACCRRSSRLSSVPNYFIIDAVVVAILKLQIPNTLPILWRFI